MASHRAAISGSLAGALSGSEGTYRQLRPRQRRLGVVGWWESEVKMSEDVEERRRRETEERVSNPLHLLYAF